MPLWGDALINQQPGLLLIVQKLPGANTLEVTKGVEEAMDEMRPGLPGIQIDTNLFRPATFIDMLDNLMEALFLGILLVILILAAFLFEWRGVHQPARDPAVPVGALLILELFDTVINVMVWRGWWSRSGWSSTTRSSTWRTSCGACGKRAEGREVSTFGVVLDASVEVRSAIIYATLIDVVAIVPVFFLSGLSGAFFQPLVLAYGLAVMVSMLVATTVTPALCLLLLSRGTESASPRSCVLARLRRGAGADHAPAVPGDRHGGPHDGRRPARLPDARAVAAAELQGERSDHVLGDEAGHVAAGDDADRGARLPGLRGGRPGRWETCSRRTPGRRCWGTRSTA